MPIDETSWIVGFVVAGVVVLIVAVVVLVIIKLATDIRDSAVRIIGDLERARDGTAPLWEVRTTNEVAGQIIEGASGARRLLGG